jgi:DNA-3-methyladenine glycosylase I
MILDRRGNYRAAFDGFDPRAVAAYDRKKVGRLFTDPGIIHNRLKINAAIKNAQSFLAVQEEFGSFDRYVWQVVGYEPVKNRWRSQAEVPSQTPQSGALSKALKRRGFSFVGPTICYAFMQSVGMVNDHIIYCFRHEEVGRSD